MGLRGGDVCCVRWVTLTPCAYVGLAFTLKVRIRCAQGQTTL
jgi:hypothetical protein